MKEQWEREQKVEGVPAYEDQPKLNLKWAELIPTTGDSSEELTLTGME